jgi:hypothetical protein
VKRQQGFAPPPFVAEVASAAAVGLVVAAIGTLVIGLLFAKAPVVVASVFCAVFAKISLEVGRRGTRDLESDAAPEGAPPGRSRPSDSVASRAMASRLPGRGERGAPGADPDLRFDELFDGEPDVASRVSRRPGPADDVRGPAPVRDAPRDAAGPMGPASAPRRAAPPSDLEESLDRFGEHLVRSLNQLFDEYVGEALGHMQAELAAERKDLGDLRTQLKAVVKAGARREEALRDELTVNRETLDELRTQLEELRDELLSAGGAASPLHDDISQLAEEVRALRKRVALGGVRRPGGGGGLDAEQIQAVADAVTAAILDNIAIEPG